MSKAPTRIRAGLAANNPTLLHRIRFVPPDASTIIDIFPMDNATRYCGDMTRTVVCGEPSDEVVAMHEAVHAAKKDGCEALRAGTTGHTVHQTTTEVKILAPIQEGLDWR